jgi:hypothetical protein
MMGAIGDIGDKSGLGNTDTGLKSRERYSSLTNGEMKLTCKQ